MPLPGSPEDRIRSILGLAPKKPQFEMEDFGPPAPRQYFQDTIPTEEQVNAPVYVHDSPYFGQQISMTPPPAPTPLQVRAQALQRHRQVQANRAAGQRR